MNGELFRHQNKGAQSLTLMVQNKFIVFFELGFV